MAIIEFVAQDYFSWAEAIGNAILNREVVKPHHDVMNEVDEHCPR